MLNDEFSSTPPKTCVIFRTKVTFIDEVRKIFIIDLLPPETCELIRKMADDHVTKLNKTNPSAPSWRTLYTYTKMDLPCKEVKGMSSKITDHIMTDVKKVVGEIFGKRMEAQKLRARSWKEPHLLKYQNVEGKM